MNPPSVFISYSHDSEDHKAWVLKLAGDLRGVGVDATVDQWDLAPGQDLAAFMQRGISHADRVLLVCSQEYVTKADAGKGGVGYERLIVTSEVVEAIDTKKFIPLVRNNPSATKTPRFLGPRLYVDFSDDAKYESSLELLSREVLGVPATTKPPLGVNPFSGEIPKASAPNRAVTDTGAVPSGEPVLSSAWFVEQKRAAEQGLQKLDLQGHMEVRLALHHPITKSQLDLLTAVKASEIPTFGWPIAVVLENRPEYTPRPFGDGIRAEISMEKDLLFAERSYDYWALTKNGDFYLLQNLFEDTRGKGVIFFNTRIVRVTEVLLFAHALYAKLGVPPEANLSVRIAHRGLAGRTLTSAGQTRRVMPKQCYEASAESEIVTRIGTIPDTLVDDVQRLLEPLFMLFEFAKFQPSVYQDIVRRFEKGEAT